MAPGWATWLFGVVVVLLAAVGASAQSDGGPALTLIPYNGFSFRLYTSGWRSTNFVLESSSDMRSWTNVFQAIGWPGTNAVYGGFYELASQQFWRARAGQPVLTLEQQWTNHEPVEYSFKFENDYMLGGIAGTVRVLNGVVAGVTNAVDRSGPILNPDLSQFLTITQLYEEVGKAFERGVEQVQVQYDPTGLYPERIVVDPILRVIDDEQYYFVSEFKVLQP